MGILDGIVEWIAEQVMAGLDLITTSVLGALGCDMAVFLRYFPAAETMYSVFVALGIGIILLNWVWQLFKNFGLGAGIEAEDPLKLSIRSVIFILLAFFSNEIVSMILTIGGTPYNWIMDSELPALSFADFNSVMLAIIGVCANGAVALITLILVIILAWNYLKLLLEAAERYVLLGVLVYTAPVAFSMGASQTTSNIWKSWCRMLGGQIFLLLMNAWCLRLFTSIPEWRRLEQEQPKPSAAQPKPQTPAPKKPVKKKPKAASTSTGTKQTAAVPTAEAPNGIITTDKDSILS